jgi:hypothetical protein
MVVIDDRNIATEDQSVVWLNADDGQQLRPTVCLLLPRHIFGHRLASLQMIGQRVVLYFYVEAPIILTCRVRHVRDKQVLRDGQNPQILS